MQSTESLRVLAIHAHPDDIELQCAGTLLRLKQLGCQVSVETMTPGDCGSAELSSEEISAVRRREAQQSASLLGADYTCLEFRDLSIVIDNDSRRRVTEVIRRTRPDLVITAPPVDYMSDHEMTSRLVRDGCFNASCPNYKTQQWDPASRHTKDPLSLLRGCHSGDRLLRRIAADRFHRGYQHHIRKEVGNARLSRQPARMAAATARIG